MPPTYYRGCWHVVSRGFLQEYRHYLPLGQKFTIRRPSSFTRRCCIRVSPNVQYSPLLPPVEFGPCLSSNVADHPLRSATDRRLGGPLPHQLANQTQVHPMPIDLWLQRHVTSQRHQVLIQVSLGYPCAWGSLPTRYSPVRRYPSPLSSEPSIGDFPLDLHVLGTPPAFILSQDQTL